MPKIPSDPPQLSNTIRATRVIRLGGNGLMCLGVILNLIFDMIWGSTTTTSKYDEMITVGNRNVSVSHANGGWLGGA